LSVLLSLMLLVVSFLRKFYTNSISKQVILSSR
jgi:hypothetical protein